jgi:4-amino-4-deoxy-L-arabinose transferase-like glycosyltransferase
MGSVRLSELNRKISSPALTKWFALSVFLFTVLVYLAPNTLRGRLGAPPEVGDAPDYDVIAVQLSKGKGFSLNWDDPDYKAPYSAQNDKGEFQYLLDRHGQGATAYRPPLLPVLMAVSFKIFGRHFEPLRVMNAIFMALATALIFALIVRRFGVIPGLLFTTLLVLLDYRSRYYSWRLLTEALACLLVTAMFCCLLRTVETKSRKWAFVLGIVTGLAFLARTVLFFWMPPIAVTVFVLTRRKGERWFGFRSLRLSLIFVAVFMIVAMPWMLRNCLVLHRFQPMGTQGDIALISAFSDQALELNGVWYNPGQFGLFDQLPQAKSPIEDELMKGDYSRTEAMKWIVRNPWKIPRLAMHKVQTEWMPTNLTQAFLLCFAALGVLVLLTFNWREVISCFCLLGTATLAVAATFSAEGRFLIPFLPILTMLSSLGIWSFVISSIEAPLDRLHLSSFEVKPNHEQRA